jgi:hypothetical protein
MQGGDDLIRPTVLVEEEDSGSESLSWDHVNTPLSQALYSQDREEEIVFG